MSAFSLLLALFFVFSAPLSSTATATATADRFIKAIPPSLRHNATQEYFELGRPLPSNNLSPSCSLQLLRHNFSNTIGRPPVTANYSPPYNCSPPWTSVVLEMRVSSKGNQYDRIAAVWLAGAEILRTSTAEPTEEGIFWNIRKDVSRYASLFQKSNLTLTVMLENLVNDEFTGVYDVHLTLLFYNSSLRVPASRKSRVLSETNSFNSESKLGFQRVDSNRDNPLFLNTEAVDSGNSLGFESVTQKDSLGFYENPADLIIPISNNSISSNVSSNVSNNVQEQGFWFRIESESDVQYTEIKIPPNTQKAVLEVYVSSHGNDEFWYSNPPDSYIKTNNLITGRGHGAYREVFLTIDGNIVGSVVPIPIIFTGGINPLFWEPIVAIGAFNLPSYNFDLAPFLGVLLDGKAHRFGLGVVDSISFWLADANLHLWLDCHSSKVEAKPVGGSSTSLSIKRSSEYELLDGKIKVKAERKSEFSGWVASSLGNLTTHLSHESKFKNTITFDRNGTHKSVEQKVTTESEMRVESETGRVISRVKVKRKYPLMVSTSTTPGSESDVYMKVTKVSHGLKEKVRDGDSKSVLNTDQVCDGWMKVKNHSVLSGSATTSQSLSYSDELVSCYSRSVSAIDGRLASDELGSCYSDELDSSVEV